MGLAVASALVVLLASGVAISRLGSDDRSGRPSETAAAETPEATAAGSASAGPATGGPAGSAADTPTAQASSPAPIPPSVPVPPVVRRSAAHPGAPPASAGTGLAAGRAGADEAVPDRAAPPSGEDGEGTDPAGSGRPGSGTDAGDEPGTGGSGGSGGSTGSPSVVAASVSVGQGANGAVVGAGLGDNPETDVTVGTNQVVGDAPPSSGTAIGLGGTFFHPPPTVPTPPG